MAAEYCRIPTYTMKCRLYPNKAQARAIDDAIYAVQCYHNCVLWDIFNNHVDTNETPYKPSKKKKEDISVDEDSVKPGDPVHFIKNSLPTVFKAEYKKRLTEEHPVIDKAPAAAITTNDGLLSDMKKELAASNNPVEFRKPMYYHKGHPRRSYSYQEAASKLSLSENRNVLFFELMKVGKVKMRGWNRKLRFDPAGETDFPAYMLADRKRKMKVTVSKDTCGDYWICFCLRDVYKAVPVPEPESAVGVDVGVKDIAITSDGQKYENEHFKKNEARHKRALNRRLSRREGWANEEFRERHRKNTELVPSGRYEKTRRAMSHLDRRIRRRRENRNHQISYSIVSRNRFIGVETLNVKGMFRNRHLANALSDAGMGELLQMIKYKSEWYGRNVRPIDKWTPSSRRCSVCGEYKKNLTLSDRTWKCEKCGTKHDRDINAARNILYYARLEEAASHGSG